jgi:ADP-ribosylglycohydrolase
MTGEARPRLAPPRDPARARGALLGLAVGDALGATLEFQDPPAPEFPALARGPHTEMVGGGPWSLAPGQATDDAQMAACLAASLAAVGSFDAADVAARYREWRRHAFDVGSQTAAALDALDRGCGPADSGHLAWLQRDRQAAGNGSLMRTAPIGVAFAAAPELRRAASLADSAVTHYDPRCRLACAAFNAAIGLAVDGRAQRPADLSAAARAELPAAAARLGPRDVEEQLASTAAVEDLSRDLDLAARSDPGLYGPELNLHGFAGFVRVAFRLAFWELLHAPDFESALVDVVNRGGDSDTNGAIAGALLGAWHGVESIPRRWRDAVLGALAGETGPLATLYHPRVLLTLLDGA